VNNTRRYARLTPRGQCVQRRKQLLLFLGRASDNNINVDNESFSLTDRISLKKGLGRGGVPNQRHARGTTPNAMARKGKSSAIVLRSRPRVVGARRSETRGGDPGPGFVFAPLAAPQSISGCVVVQDTAAGCPRRAAHHARCALLLTAVRPRGGGGGGGNTRRRTLRGASYTQPNTMTTTATSTTATTTTT